MNVEQTLFQFIDFYLMPNLSQKSIDLLKVNLDRKSKSIADPLLREVTLIRETLKILSSRRKPPGQALIAENSSEKFYVEVLRLKPQDCLILASQELFAIPLYHLALALNTSAESLEFRRNQLLSQFAEEGYSLKQLKTVASATIPAEEKKRASYFEQGGMLQNFQKLPLALRFTIETSLILMALLGLLWLIPEIRNRYENSIQRRINDYLIESSLVDSPAPAGTSKTAKLLTADAAPADPEEAEEVTGLNKSSSSDDLSSRKQPKVNEGETWRFSFTGASTSEIEAGVISSLQKLSITSEKPLTVPGGIQFNFVLPSERVIPLKSALEQLVNDIQQKGSTKGGGMNAASFSWYKKRNMGTRKIPSGHVQVIVWISTL